MTNFLAPIVGMSFLEQAAFVVLDWTVQATVVLGVAAMCAWALRRHSASLRHLVWLTATAGTLLLPLTNRLVPGYPLPISSFRTNSGFLSAESAATCSLNDSNSHVPLDDRSECSADVERSVENAGNLVLDNRASTRLPQCPDDRFTVSRNAMSNPDDAFNGWMMWGQRPWPMVWMTGTGLMLLPFLIGSVSLALMKRTSRPFPADMDSLLKQLAADLGIRRPILAGLTDSRRIPMTWGLFRTHLVLPADAIEWDEKRLRIVMLHELGHIGRWDFHTQLVGHLLRAVHWFNPLAWFALSQLRLEQERSTDDVVLNKQVSGPDYAVEILSLTSRTHRAFWDVSLALGMSRYSRLESRITAILDERQDRQLVSPSSRCAFIVAGLLLIAFVAAPAVESDEVAFDTNSSPVVNETSTGTMSQPEESIAEASPTDFTRRERPSLEARSGVVFVAQMESPNLESDSEPVSNTEAPSAKPNGQQTDEKHVATDEPKAPKTNSPQVAPSAPSAKETPLTLEQIQELIQTSSAVPIDRNDLTEGAIKGMLSALNDDYSTVITPEQLSNLTTGSSSIVGIGVQLAKSGNDERLLVLKALPNSPAAKAGLKPDDELLAVDEQNVNSLDAAVSLIRGKAGQPVKLKLKRTSGEIEQMTVVRQVVPTIVVPVAGLRQNQDGQWQYWLDRSAKIGYVHVSQFTGSTTRQLESVIKQLQAEGLKGLVLDLRGNVGGLLPDCVSTASLFLREGSVVRITNRDDGVLDFTVTGQVVFPDLPLAVLINGTTASAAEILAGTLQDHDRAILVGERTFGKGSLQSIHPLGQTGGAIRLTTAYLETPGGRKINRSPGAKSWGIDPSDGWYVSMNEEDRKTMSRHVVAGAPLPEPLTPESLEAARHDTVIPAAWRAMRGKLETGEFPKTGKSLQDMNQSLATRDDLIRQRDQLRNKLQSIEKQLAH
jgi:carboxyl-terminal processing protease